MPARKGARANGKSASAKAKGAAPAATATAKAKASTSGKDSDAGEPSETDLTRWRLEVDHGRHVWHYLQTDAECAAWPQTEEDKHWLGLDTVRG